MVIEVMYDPIFLAGELEIAIKEDLQVAHMSKQMSNAQSNSLR